MIRDVSRYAYKFLYNNNKRYTSRPNGLTACWGLCA